MAAITQPSGSIVDAAIHAVRHHLSVLPIQPDSKKPLGKWAGLQSERMSEPDVLQQFGGGAWIGVIGGAVSDNLEVLDFDIPGKHQLAKDEKGTPPSYKPFCEQVKLDGRTDLLKRLVVIQTPSGGMHLLYRCAERVEGNTKLAEGLYGGKTETLIETRGEKGYFVTVPTPGYVLKRGSFDSIPVISCDERQYLLETARSLNEVVSEFIPPRSKDRDLLQSGDNLKPGDDFNQRAAWSDVLEPHGWTYGGKSGGGREAWVRPGKTRHQGISATTGNGGEKDLLYVHSSNASPFNSQSGYQKFAAYALLECGGDFSLAAQQLQAKGYGDPPQRPSSAPPLPRPTERRSSAELPSSEDDEVLETKQFDPATFKLAEPSFLVDPYLPRGKCVLLDADGGTGKSSLALAFAAWLSIGREPVVGTVREPCRILYLHKGEDSNEELATVFLANGGELANISFYSGSVNFDPEGLAKIERTIKKGKFELVIVDALFYFLSSLMKDTYNALPAMAVMEQLNGIAARTQAVFWNIRHTKLGQIGQKASEMGMGSVQFRNSHRGQILLRWHPEKSGVVVATDEKGSIMVQRGPHFCFRRVGLEVQYIVNEPNPFSTEAESAAKKDGRLGNCEEAIREILTGQIVLSDDLNSRLRTLGFSKGTIDRARAGMREIISRPGRRFGIPDDRWRCTITPAKDPFEETD